MPLTHDALRLLTDPPDLPTELRQLLLQIPIGQTVSFGDLAEALGDLKAARWVAMALQDFQPDEFPVHRVIRRTGRIVGTRQLPHDDRMVRLRGEGVVINDETVDGSCRVRPEFVGTRPLATLMELQQRLAPLVTLLPLEGLPERLAGVDVSYAAGDLGVAAYTVVETRTGKLLHQELIADEVRFPYIPGYLSFREMPLYRKLLEQVHQAGNLEPWLLVDGNGILHPRRAGIATMLGCALSIRTVGVSKHLLCGKVADPSADPAEIRAGDGELLGYCLNRGTKRSTLYVSPGTGVDAAGALRLAESVMCGHRLPEPLYHADRLSREAARQRKSRV